MGIVERKLCVDCGETNLEDEAGCWACGGRRFAPDGTRLAGEATASLGGGTEPTRAWRHGGRPPVSLLYAAAAVTFATLTCVVGYWLGRTSVPPPAPARTFDIPVELPAPPSGAAGVPVFPISAPEPGPAIPRVTVRSHPAAVPPAPLPEPRPARPTAAAPRLPAPVPVKPRAVQVVRAPLAVPPPAMVAPPAPKPAAGRATVSVRNDTDASVSVSLDGPSGRTTAVVAPGSSVPFSLAGGGYQLRALGQGLSSAQSALAVAAGRSYSLVVARRGAGDADSLVVIEPAIDGVGD